MWCSLFTKMPEFILYQDICFWTIRDKIGTTQKAEALGPPLGRQPAAICRWLAAKQWPQASVFWEIFLFCPVECFAPVQNMFWVSGKYCRMLTHKISVFWCFIVLLMYWVLFLDEIYQSASSGHLSCCFIYCGHCFRPEIMFGHLKHLWCLIVYLGVLLEQDWYLVKLGRLQTGREYLTGKP